MEETVNIEKSCRGALIRATSHLPLKWNSKMELDGLIRLPYYPQDTTCLAALPFLIADMALLASYSASQGIRDRFSDEKMIQ